MADENNEIDFDSPEFDAAIEEARNRSKETATTVVDNTAENTDATPAAAATTTVDTTTQTTAADTSTPNYGEYFKTTSEGLINSEDEFKAALTKVKNYDSLETKLKDTETKIPTFKNPESEALFNAWTGGEKDAVINYIKETQKDYKTMSDYDVRLEAISKANPNWTKAEVDLEMRTTYGEQLEKIDLASIDKELEPDEYKEAIAHNKEVDRNLLLLQRDARDDRYKLIEQQSKIELPQIKKAEAPAPTTQPTEAELAEATNRWVKNVEDNLPKLSNIKMNIDNKEVEYVRSDDEKKELTEYMKTFNIFNFAKESGWYNEDGTPNSLKIAEDVHFLKNREAVTKSFATQVKTDTTKNVFKQIKNVDGTYTEVDTRQAFDSLEEAAWDAIDKAKAKRKAAQEQE
jgi:hypothetical protein